MVHQKDRHDRQGIEQRQQTEFKFYPHKLTFDKDMIVALSVHEQGPRDVTDAHDEEQLLNLFEH